MLYTVSITLTVDAPIPLHATGEDIRDIAWRKFMERVVCGDFDADSIDIVKEEE